MGWNELQSNGTNDTVISRQTRETGMQLMSQRVAFSNIMKHQNEHVVLVSGCRWDSAAAMTLDRSVKACAGVRTWPGTTALENNLFS